MQCMVSEHYPEIRTYNLKWFDALQECARTVDEDHLPDIIETLSQVIHPFFLSEKRHDRLASFAETMEEFFAEHQAPRAKRKIKDAPPDVDYKRVRTVIRTVSSMHKRCFALPESPLRDRALHLLQRIENAYRAFLGGAIFASPDVDAGLLPATLDVHDVRTLARRENIHAIPRGNVHEKKMQAEIVQAYREEHILNAFTIEFVLARVPVASIQYLLSLFSKHELVIRHKSIGSAEVAQAIAADPYNHEYIEFIATLIRQTGAFSFRDNYFSLDDEEDEDVKKQKKPFGKVLFEVLTGEPHERVQAFLSISHTYQLEHEYVLMLLQTPGYNLEKFADDCARYAPVFKPSDIVEIYQTEVPLHIAHSFAQKLPFIMQGGHVVLYCLQNKEIRDALTPSVLTDIRAFFAGTDCFTIDMLQWYVGELKRNKRTVQFLQSVGCTSMEYIYAFVKQMRTEIVPMHYVKKILRVGRWPDVNMGTLMNALQEWHAAQITSEEMRAARGVWDIKKGVSWASVEPVHLRQYLEIQKKPEQFQVMLQVCKKFDLVPAEITHFIAQGLVEADFDALHELELDFHMFPAVLAWGKSDFEREWRNLKQEEKVLVVGFGPNRLAEKKKANPKLTLGELTQFPKQKHTDSVSGVNISQDESYASYLKLLQRPPDDMCNIELLQLFGVSPEYMQQHLLLATGERVLSDVATNHIILCAYIENKIPPDLVPLIERYHIAQFSRYPVDVLESMARGFGESAPQKVACILRAKTDYSSAGEYMHDTCEQLSAGYRVYIYEVATKSDVIRALKDMNTILRTDESKIDLLMFDGHGSEDCFQMGYPYSNTRTHLTPTSTRYLAPFRKILADDAQCIFGSCSAARGGRDADAIAYVLADTWKDVQVFAANANTAITEIHVDDSGRVKTVDFQKPEQLVVIKSTPTA
jgi:hypothetical protein